MSSSFVTSNGYIKTSVAIDGYGAAPGEDALAIGMDSKATHDGSIALGEGASATAANAIAIGTGAIAESEGELSLGSVDHPMKVVVLSQDTSAPSALEARVNGVQYLIPLSVSLDREARLRLTGSHAEIETYGKAVRESKVLHLEEQITYSLTSRMTAEQTAHGQFTQILLAEFDNPDDDFTMVNARVGNCTYTTVDGLVVTIGQIWAEATTAKIFIRAAINVTDLDADAIIDCHGTFPWKTTPPAP